MIKCFKNAVIQMGVVVVVVFSFTLSSHCRGFLTWSPPLFFLRTATVFFTDFQSFKERYYIIVGIDDYNYFLGGGLSSLGSYFFGEGGGGRGGDSPLFFQPFSFSLSWENFVPRLLLFLYIIIRAATGFFTFFQGFEERTFKWNCIKSLSLFCFFFSSERWQMSVPPTSSLSAEL